jgi:capsular polysaccharide transport system permease protein
VPQLLSAVGFKGARALREAEPNGTENGEAETASAANAADVVETEPDSQSHALALSTDGGPVAVEIELELLPVRPTLRSSRDAEVVEPAVGFWRRHRLFIVTVVLPMLVGGLYLAVAAAPRFASSTSFMVKSAPSIQPGLLMAALPQGASTITGAPNPSSASNFSGSPSQPSSPTLSASPNLSLASNISGAATAYSNLSSYSGISAGSATHSIDATYAVNAYLTSRDIVDQLAKNNHLRQILARPEGDFVFRFPTFWLPDDNEFLYQRFQWMVSATIDPDTYVSTIEVNAFRPEDAQKLAAAILGYAESLVNKMNERGYQDELANAERFVADAQKQVDAAEALLQNYRNTSGSIDPNLVSQSELTVIQGLSTQLAQIEAMIAQQRAISPNSPMLASLRAQRQSYAAEIEKRKREIAGSAGSEADKLETYEELNVRRNLAANVLAAAVTERDQARQDAARQHLFIQIVAQPNLSLDYARYPRVAVDLLILLVICLVAFRMIRKVSEIDSNNRQLG